MRRLVFEGKIVIVGEYVPVSAKEMNNHLFAQSSKRPVPALDRRIDADIFAALPHEASDDQQRESPCYVCCRVGDGT